MKILFISHASSMGGAPISLLTLIEYFMKQTNWDIKVLVRYDGVLYPQFEEIAETLCYCQFRHYKSGLSAYLDHKGNTQSVFGKYILGRLRRLTALLDSFIGYIKQALHIKSIKCVFDQWKPDLVYSNTAVNGDIIRRLQLEKMAPIFVHVRELDKSLRVLLNASARNYLQKYPSYYFAVSNAVRADLLEKDNIDPARIRIAPVAINTKKILSFSNILSQKDIEKQYGINESDIVVGGVGFAGKRKGIDIFVEIAEKIIRHYGKSMRIVFIWIGDGDMKQYLMTVVKNLGLEREILFTGMVMNPYPLIKRFDFVLMCSRDDPFPRINLEAGALGVPIITFSDSGGSKEFASERCGVVVQGFDKTEMFDKAIELIEKPDLRKKIGRKAKDKVGDCYDVSSVAIPLIEFIEKTKYEKPKCSYPIH